MIAVEQIDDRDASGLGIIPASAPVRRADEIGLLTVGLGDPFVVPARRDDTAMAPERVAKHGPVNDALRSRIEGRRQLFQRLVPPIGNEPPSALLANGVRNGCGRHATPGGTSWPGCGNAKQTAGQLRAARTASAGSG